jgi:hypothetical protein
MPAEIVPFPKKSIKLQTIKSIDLRHCWDYRLQNPYLNTLYRSEVSYAERWYLQARRYLCLHQLDHPIIATLLNKSDYTLNILINSVNDDLRLQLKAMETSDCYVMISNYNITRLSKWRKKWQGLVNYRDQL